MVALLCYLRVNKLWVGFHNFEIQGIVPEHPNSTPETKGIHSYPEIKTQLVTNGVCLFTTKSCFNQPKNTRFVAADHASKSSEYASRSGSITILDQDIHRKQE